MAQINIEVNGRPYAVGCEDGQEGHLQELAKLFDHQVRQVSQGAKPRRLIITIAFWSFSRTSERASQVRL